MENTELPEMMLLLVLGLRHGLDPDHIAVIDGLTMRSQEKNKSTAPWVGTFFALGHGLVITIIAVAIHFMSGFFTLPKMVFRLLEWLPVALLLFVGILNLRSLLAYQDDFKPAGWRSRFVPKKIREKSHPFSILLTGIIFALVFDTATQAAAWGYAASSTGGWATALQMGLIFTTGMVFTDTLDGFLLNKIWQCTGNKKVLIKSRRILGWGIVCLAFLVVGYETLTAFAPTAAFSDTTLSLIGGSFFLSILIFYSYTLFISSANQNTTKYGH